MIFNLSKLIKMAEEEYGLDYHIIHTFFGGMQKILVDTVNQFVKIHSYQPARKHNHGIQQH